MISTIERFDVNACYKLLDNKHFFKGKIRKELFQNDEYNPFKMLENYVRNSKNGKIKVNYRQKNNRGRFFADHACGLQSMAREIRGTIAGDFYYDIDMVNCHPMIFKKLCDDAKLNTTYLTSLCYDRDKIIRELINIIPESNKNMVKQGILSIINGGVEFYKKVRPFCKKESYAWLGGFLKEVKFNIDKLCELNSDLYEEVKKSGKERPKSSTINILFCIEENYLLDIMINYFREVGVIDQNNNYVNCFDGVMVEKKKCKNLKKLEIYISEIEKLFQNVGYSMKLNIKPFETIDLYLSEDDVKTNLSVSGEIEIFNRFNHKDAYTFLDLYNTFSEREFNSLEDIKTQIEPLFPKVIAKVLTGDGIYIKKTSSGIDITRRLGLSDFTMKYMSDRVMKSLKLSNLLKEYKSFGELVCKLNNNETTGNKSFNIWSGFQAERVDLHCLKEETREGLELMKTFIMEVWASCNEEYYNYIISWFAGLVTNLDGINRVALAMVSKEGCGKGTLTDFMSYILGNDSIAETIGIQSITQKHNTIIQNKRLVLVNEMSSTKEEFRSNFDKIKSLITDSHIQIEPKGVASYKIDNIGNYILCTNHADSIIVGEHDRRYAVFEASDAHINDWDYFENLRAKCFNQDVANAFYTYLLEFDVVPLGKIPKTAIRQQLQSQSLPTPLKFVNYVIEEEVYTEGQYVSGSELYLEYSRWCSNNGERSVSNTKFGMLVKEKWTKTKSCGVMKYNITYHI